MLGTNISISPCTGESSISVGSSVSRSWDCHVYRYCNRINFLLVWLGLILYNKSLKKRTAQKHIKWTFTTGLPAIKKKVYHQGNRRYMYNETLNKSGIVTVHYLRTSEWLFSSLTHQSRLCPLTALNSLLLSLCSTL